MNYTPKQRTQIAKALSLTKPYLWDGSSLRAPFSEYICFALNRGAPLGAPRTLARGVVMTRIYPCLTVKQWLNANVRTGRCSARALQQYRHRWLDALIEEFSA